MGYRSGEQAGEHYTNLFFDILKWIVVPFIGAFIVYVALDVVLELLIKNLLGLHKPAVLTTIEKGIGFIVFLCIIYLFKGGRFGKPKVQQATVTTSTGLKVDKGVYNIPTYEKDIKIIKITLPNRHVLVAGSPGSGKSFSIIEPIIMDAMQQGKAGLVYDYDFPGQARIVNALAKGVKPYYINFHDLNYSHRINPIHPDVMTEMSYAKQFASIVINNLTTSQNGGADSNGFFNESAIGYLALIFWYLRCEHPAYCTIPHAILLAFQDTEQVIKLLESSKDAITRTSVRPMRNALKASNQLAAIEGTTQQKLQLLISKQIFWVLSGHDFTMDLNNPDAKKVLVLGNNEQKRDVFGPILALLATVALKEMNQRDRAPSICSFDEFPTIYIPNFETYPATCRKNKIDIIVGIQDFSQFENRYGKSMRNSIMGTLNNQFFGLQNELESAKYVSELWGKEDVEATSVNQSEQLKSNNGSEGKSVSMTERQRIKVQDVTNLSEGEFYGKLVKSDFSTFKARIRPIERPASIQTSWKPFNNVTPEMLHENFERIEADILSLMEGKLVEPEPEKPAPSQPPVQPQPTPSIKKVNITDNDF